MIDSPERIGTVVIGGSQAGLAAGYHLRRRGLPFVILEQASRVGEAWRTRWESLRLFTPGRYDGLPGMPFPGPPGEYPSKDAVADYLEHYARTFALPVRTGVRVDRLSRSGDRFAVSCGGPTLLAEHVIVATGAAGTPRVPPFASELDGGIRQFHSAAYRQTSQLQAGGVLVVGAGNSGAEIAMELAPSHRVWLSGPDTGQEPTGGAGSAMDRLITPIIWLMATRVLTVRTRLGRRVRRQFLEPPRGLPLGRVRRKDFAAAGIERVPRTTGVDQGRPRLEDGRTLDVANVVWCSGFRPDYDWIALPLQTHYGVPQHARGVVDAVPGLYFLGLLFQYSMSSSLLGGVGRDAEYIVDHIAGRR